MMTPPDAQRQSQDNRLHQLVDSDVFTQNRSDDKACEQAFVEVIQLLNAVLTQSEQSGRRIDFTKEVGVQGKVQDVTSLVSSLARSLILKSGQPNQFADGQFNCYQGAGTGYFANGAFFTADHADDVAFYVGDQRIYLNRHIKRAMQEAGRPSAHSSVPVTML